MTRPRRDPSGRDPSGRHGEPARPGRAPSAGPPVASPPAHLRRLASELFGDRLDLAVRYAELLQTDGVSRGLIGPHEGPRTWDRHLLNCAVVGELIPMGARVVDVGSGAGLPGVVLALARPDLHVTLLEPMARRTAFLAEVVSTLGLEGVSVVRARAEEWVDAGSSTTRTGDVPGAGLVGESCRQDSGAGRADVVTARAVAPLDRLAAWCLPLATIGGRVLALKGESARAEAARHVGAIRRLGGSEPVVQICGAGALDPPTLVVEIRREHHQPRTPRRRSRAAPRRRQDG